MDLEKLRYPIGKFKPQDTYSAQEREGYINEIMAFPFRFEALVVSLNEAQLDTPYRPGGWTVRQVIHHVPDSHMNAYIRFKLALTEDKPVIRPYFEQHWAELPDSKNAPINLSLPILHSIHARWVFVLKNMTENQWQREYFHPEHNKSHTLAEVLAMYAWHGEHHYQHINQLKMRNFTLQ